MLDCVVLVDPTKIEMLDGAVLDPTEKAVADAGDMSPVNIEAVVDTAVVFEVADVVVLNEDVVTLAAGTVGLDDDDDVLLVASRLEVIDTDKVDDPTEELGAEREDVGKDKVDEAAGVDGEVSSDWVVVADPVEVVNEADVTDDELELKGDDTVPASVVELVTADEVVNEADVTDDELELKGDDTGPASVVELVTADEVAELVVGGDVIVLVTSGVVDEDELVVEEQATKEVIPDGVMVDVCVTVDVAVVVIVEVLVGAVEVEDVLRMTIRPYKIWKL